MTDRERAIVMAHTGICMLTGDRINAFYEYLAELYGRPVYTHEILFLNLEEKSRPDFIRLCEGSGNMTEQDKIINDLRREVERLKAENKELRDFKEVITKQLEFLQSFGKGRNDKKAR